ncbi:peptide-methionine (S)-S-oxide reductase MsrA [Vibrio navarrensis]|uniref:Peptide methionine sulfoxide reductase MsrA n=1 Tax=Vibrio navarrensis TaxID=29495 RepID=A0AAJ4IAV6_9VIBR|nr:peptide-methionine (S)-S-oxide reductase MsrA [Vibrio navarrensis]
MLNKQIMVSQESALPGRATPLRVETQHFINHSDITAAVVGTQQEILLGMGCFWGAERLFWQLDGVVSTSVGYSGGFTPNPTYEEVCSGQTGHTEVVRVVFESQQISLSQLLEKFWERHDPTQGMRQGNDLGTQYRSVIYTYGDEQLAIATASKEAYQRALSDSQRSTITTEIAPAGEYYFAETYHQQYLAKNPDGYCGLGGTGVCFPPQA